MGSMTKTEKKVNLNIDCQGFKMKNTERIKLI